MHDYVPQPDARSRPAGIADAAYALAFLEDRIVADPDVAEHEGHRARPSAVEPSLDSQLGPDALS